MNEVPARAPRLAVGNRVCFYAERTLGTIVEIDDKAERPIAVAIDDPSPWPIVKLATPDQLDRVADGLICGCALLEAGTVVPCAEHDPDAERPPLDPILEADAAELGSIERDYDRARRVDRDREVVDGLLERALAVRKRLAQDTQAPDGLRDKAEAIVERLRVSRNTAAAGPALARQLEAE